MIRKQESQEQWNTQVSLETAKVPIPLGAPSYSRYLSYDGSLIPSYSPILQSIEAGKFESNNEEVKQINKEKSNT